MPRIFDIARWSELRMACDAARSVHQRLWSEPADVFSLLLSDSQRRVATYGSSAVSGASPAMVSVRSRDLMVIVIGGYSTPLLGAPLLASYYVPPVDHDGVMVNRAARRHYDNLGLDTYLEALTDTQEVLVVGYSGGGVLAAMACRRMAEKISGNRVSCVTFGCPRVGYDESGGRWGGFHWVRLNTEGDDVEFLAAHSLELPAAFLSNPILQWYADHWWSYGLGVYLPDAGDYLVRGQGRQLTSDHPVNGNQLGWMTGSNHYVLDRDAHKIDVYLDRISKISYDHVLRTTRLWAAEPPPMVQPIDVPMATMSRTEQVRAYRASGASVGQAVTTERVGPVEGSRVVLPPLVHRRRAFVAIRHQNGWWVSYLTLPVFRMGSKRGAQTKARELNRLCEIIAASPEPNIDTLVGGVVSETSPPS